jgi:hypothetical protein
MKLSTMKKYVAAYTKSCRLRTGGSPDKSVLREHLRAFDKALQINKIDL